MGRRMRIGGAFLAALLVAAGGAGAQVTLRGSAVAAGASDASAGDISARSTIGQAAAGVAADGGYDARIGFWHLVTPAVVTGLDGAEETPPSVFHLDGNRPNPFNPTTTISFSIAKEGRVRLTVYDVAGREVAALVDRSLPAGRHEAVLRADRLASGVYFYRLRSGSETATGRMVLIR